MVEPNGTAQFEKATCPEAQRKEMKSWSAVFSVGMLITRGSRF